MLFLKTKRFMGMVKIFSRVVAVLQRVYKVGSFMVCLLLEKWARKEAA